MEDTEDLSARVLLRGIFNTEPSRTPITRSVSGRQSSSTATRRSSRRSHTDAAQTPQAILRRSLKHKLAETITRKSLPAPQRRSTAAMPRKDRVSSSMLFADGDTPRHLLVNILQTEPGKSPMVHDGGPPEEKEPPAGTSSTRTRPSIELSSLDLPDLTIGNVISTSKGLSRKRPRRSLNVTAFEKRLRGADDAEEKSEESIDDQLSLSSLSSTSLSLKTPFADPQTERRGLQRKVSQRRKFSVEEFGAAVNKRQTGGVDGLVPAGRDLSETTDNEGVTLGLSKLSEPDLTIDIVHCNTALYPQPDPSTSDTSITATQDKPTVMVSKLELDIKQDGVLEVEQSKQDEDALAEVTADNQSDGRVSLSPGAVDEAQEEEAEGAAHGEPETNFESKLGDEEGAADSQAGASESDKVADPGDEEEDAADSQPEEDVDAGSDEEKAVKDVQSEEKKGADAEADDGEAQKKKVSEPVRDEEEADRRESLPQHPLETGHQILHQFEEDEDKNGPQTEDDGDREDEERRDSAAEHISRRSRQSQGALVHIAEAGKDVIDSEAAGVFFADSKAHPASDLQSQLEAEELQISVSSAEDPEQAESSNPERSDPVCADNEPGADEESSLHAEEAGEHPSGNSPEEAAPEGADEGEEWEEEEGYDDEFGDLPSKTPAFVKERRRFTYPDPSASPVPKNLQAGASKASEGLSAAEPKQVRQRKRRPVEKKKRTLPKSYLMTVFKHFAKTKVSGDVYPVLDEVMESFFVRLTSDLEAYATHAKRKTIEVEDTVLLLKRQGHVNDKVPVEVLIEKYLRLEQRKLLIPIATSGNVVIPKTR